MRRQRGRIVREIMARGQNDGIVGAYRQYDGQFDMTITLMGKQHTRRFVGHLQDYADLASALPGHIDTLRAMCVDRGDTEEARRYADLRDALPQMTADEKTLKTLAFVVALSVLETLSLHSGEMSR